jgi:hypothetical protein
MRNVVDHACPQYPLELVNIVQEISIEVNVYEKLPGLSFMGVKPGWRRPLPQGSGLGEGAATMLETEGGYKT